MARFIGRDRTLRSLRSRALLPGRKQPVEDVPYNRLSSSWTQGRIVTDKSYPLQLVVEDADRSQTLRGAYIDRQWVSAGQQVRFEPRFYLSFTNNFRKARCRRIQTRDQN